MVVEWLDRFWPQIAGALGVLASALATMHVILARRDVPTAGGWVAVIWLSPIIGPVLYMMLGVNRIERKAALLRRKVQRYSTAPSVAGVVPGELEQRFTQGAQLAEIARAIARVTRRPLLPGNRIAPLVDGDAAYPSMLEAIAGARRSITLLTYIFDGDAVGRRFVDALAEARRRGVEVRVLVDAAGERYSRPPIHRVLRKRGIPCATFLPFSSALFRYFNLRNHRKILVVDGQVGFTGGMNIRAGHWLSEHPRSPIRDVHFRVEGPVVAQLQEVFAEDWEFTTKEALSGDLWFPPLEARGQVMARGISDGPDEELDRLPITMLAALSSARRSIRLMTPYFLPEAALVGELEVAAMRGLSVDIVIPEKGNIVLVDWAMRALLGQLIECGCRVWLTPAPFDHGKLLVIDGAWSLIGSTNWDPRSLRLNFESNLEAYDAVLATELEAIVDERIARARSLSAAELDRRSLPVRLRDGVARLLTPYL